MVNDFFCQVKYFWFQHFLAEAPNPIMNNAVGRDLGIQTVFFL